MCVYMFIAAFIKSVVAVAYYSYQSLNIIVAYAKRFGIAQTRGLG